MSANLLQTSEQGIKVLDLLDLKEPLLINTIGHATGVLLFGLFIWLFLHDRRGAQRRRNWLPVTIAALALCWNLGSLAVLATSHYGLRSADLLVAISFSVLSLLPALLLHFSLEGRLPGIRIAGYVLSGFAVVCHFIELWVDSVKWHQVAILSITVGFTILTAASVWMLRRSGDAGGSRDSHIWGAMCLFLFAISFAHFGTGHARHAWSAEIAVHHAGIPLALVVLLRDYRFLLVDAFLRFLINGLVAAGFLLSLALATARFSLLDRAAGDKFLEGLLGVGACLLLLAFAFVRGSMQRWLTRRIFLRPDPASAIPPLRRLGATCSNEQEYVEKAANQIGEFIGANRVDVTDTEPAAVTLPEKVSAYPVTDRSIWRSRPDTRWVEAVVPIRIAGGAPRQILLGRRGGGRRYLSEDLTSLNQLAQVVTEQVERFRQAEMETLVSRAELRALQAQINPHFLFNSLNTLYGTISRENADARQIVLNLADIFRFFLQSEKTFIPMAEELRIVEAYLQIETLRLGGRLTTEIDVDDRTRSILIPKLSIQPLVENAVKHGIATQAGVGRIRLRVQSSAGGATIRVEDTGSGFQKNRVVSEGSGVGLDNVRRRLRLCYGSASDLVITSSGSGCTVEFMIPSTAVLSRA